MDTVPNGGPYDGALGVIAALESLRVLKESGQTLPVTLECIAFTDEEGRYAGLTGSQLAAGAYSRDAAQQFYNTASQFAADVAAMDEFLPTAFTVDNLLAAKRPAGEVLAFVELHIEQGPQLEHAHKSIGIVDAIFGRVSCQVVFTGRSDHAGTTPMTLRADALDAAARFITHMIQFVRRRVSRGCPNLWQHRGLTGGGQCRSQGGASLGGVPRQLAGSTGQDRLRSGKRIARNSERMVGSEWQPRRSTAWIRARCTRRFSARFKNRAESSATPP